MALLDPGTPASQPLLGYLVAGFIMLVIGLAALTARRRAPAILNSPEGTRRALLYALVYTMCASSFARVLTPALLGQERSPWLLALGDVIFVTLGLFVWVMVLAEGRPWRDYGFRGTIPARMILTLFLGLAAAAFYASRSYMELASGRLHVTADSLVFALLFAAAGSAVPEEVLFRGFLQGSLEGRAGRWARVVLPALAFTALRALRFAPGSGMSVAGWVSYLLGTALPLGLWYGLIRELAKGSLWPSLVSHFALEFGIALANASPAESAIEL